MELQTVTLLVIPIHVTRFVHVTPLSGVLITLRFVEVF